MNSPVIDAVMVVVEDRLMAGKFDEAIEVLDRERRKEPSNYLFPQRLGDLYRSLERTFDAIHAYEQAIALAPDRSELWAKKGDALIDAGAGDAAVQAFRKASLISPSAFTELDWNVRGDRCYVAQDFPTARRLYECGLEVRANADGWGGLGLIAMDSDDFDDAVKAFSKGIELEPQDADLLNNLGRAYLKQGRSAEALDLFQKVVMLAPTEPNYWFNLGVTSRDSEDFEAAHAAFLRVVEMEPEDAEAWIELGQCELKLGDGEVSLRRALRSFDRATEADEYALWGWNNAGSVLSDLGEYEAAVERFERAIELDETDITPWSNKFWALVNSGEFARAEIVAEEMLRVVEDRAEALRLKAALLADWLSRSREALDIYRAALALRPGDELIESGLAEALLHVGEHAKSRRIARRLLQRELEEDVRCALLFIVFATYVLDGRRSANRHAAFREFIEYFQSQFVTADPKPFTWNYQGLLEMIHRDSEITNAESAFLLLLAIDLQVGTLDARSASFFTGQIGSAPRANTVDAPVARVS